jgi:Protein of unknown function (DUF4238)
MSNPTRSNHFSPKFSNKYWANSKGEITKMFRSLEGTIRHEKTTARKWGCEDYSHPQHIEDEFSKVESKVAPIYKTLVAHEKLDPAERMIWSYWILCQFARTPTMKLELAGFPEDVFGSLDMEFNSSWAEIDARISSLADHGLEFPKNKELLAFVALRDWIVLHPAKGEFFIKGDTPVVIRGALVDDNAVIVYPLAPDACFTATVIGSFPPSQLQGDLLLKPTETLFYQRLVASKADREVICHPDHFSPPLSATVAEHLGADTRSIHHSRVPNW